MLSKETFIESIKTIQEQNAIDEQLSEALSVICYEKPMLATADKVVTQLIKVLVENMNDVNGFIEWYLFEDVDDRRVYVDNKEIANITDESILYDFLVSEYGEQ